MSMIRVLNAVATAVAGTVGWSEVTNPEADPEVVAAMLGEVGIHAVPGQLHNAVRRFQGRSGLRTDGIAGPETVHALATVAAEHRHLREIGLAA
jgi:murein L,D-transpeptidase YcbB/YkuD